MIGSYTAPLQPPQCMDSPVPNRSCLGNSSTGAVELSPDVSDPKKGDRDATGSDSVILRRTLDPHLDLSIQITNPTALGDVCRHQNGPGPAVKP